MTKLLSDAELDERYDSLGIGLLDAATGGEIVILETILVQAKLANRIQKQAAEIAARHAKANEDMSQEFFKGATTTSRRIEKAILAMEVKDE